MPEELKCDNWECELPLEIYVTRWQDASVRYALPMRAGEKAGWSHHKTEQ